MKLFENKKLFGKINILDILIVVVVLVVGGFAYFKLFGEDGKMSIGGKYVDTVCEIKLDGVHLGMDKYIEVGSEVYDNETNVYIGKVVSFTSGDYITTRQDNVNNKYVRETVPGKESVYLNVAISVADTGPDLINENNYYIKVGKRLDIRAKNFAGSGYITDIQRLDEEAK